MEQELPAAYASLRCAALTPSALLETYVPFGTRPAMNCGPIRGLRPCGPTPQLRREPNLRFGRLGRAFRNHRLLKELVRRNCFQRPEPPQYARYGPRVKWYDYQQRWITYSPPSCLFERFPDPR